jgi:hypothetical protein
MNVPVIVAEIFSYHPNDPKALAGKRVDVVLKAGFHGGEGGVGKLGSNSLGDVNSVKPTAPSFLDAVAKPDVFDSS